MNVSKRWCVLVFTKLSKIDILLSQNVSSCLAICQVNNIYLPPTRGRDATYIGQKDTAYLTQADRDEPEEQHSQSSQAGALWLHEAKQVTWGVVV